MLELRPNCECCDRDLPPDAIEASLQRRHDLEARYRPLTDAD